MLKMFAPAHIGFQLPRPQGLPDVDTDRARMIREIGLAPGHPALASDEKDTLFLSLALTLGRASYHHQRFLQISELLEQRRVQTGGVASFDMFAQYALFEASACLGAVRLGIDEIIFIAARLRAITPSDIYNNWKTEAVFTAQFTTRPEFNIPEILALRNRQPWYRQLNAYRNVLFHRGWRPPFGAYFPIDSTQAEALDPQVNVMMVPDLTSLNQQTRPHQWTYANRNRLENVIDNAVHGFEELLDDVCINTWGGGVPPRGSMPKEEQPNVFALTARPGVFNFGSHVILPIFTSEAHARVFNAVARNPNIELISLTSTTFIVGEPAFTFSLLGANNDPNLASLTGDLVFVLDPIAVDAAKCSITARKETRVPWAEALAAEGVQPISLPADWVGTEQIFVWRQLPIQ